MDKLREAWKSQELQRGRPVDKQDYPVRRFQEDLDRLSTLHERGSRYDSHLFYIPGTGGYLGIEVTVRDNKPTYFLRTEFSDEKREEVRRKFANIVGEEANQ